jgi:molybdopterin synthase catalytic subunit
LDNPQLAAFTEQINSPETKTMSENEKTSASGSVRIELTDREIDYHALTEEVRTTQAGAVVLFLGTVRELTQGQRTLALDYEAYPGMAEAKMHELVREAAERWPIQNAAIVHRLGHLELGDISIALAVSCPHRRDAFEAGQFLIDEFKLRVPVWKKENWADGTTAWVHPTLGNVPPTPATPPES